MLESRSLVRRASLSGQDGDGRAAPSGHGGDNVRPPPLAMKATGACPLPVTARGVLQVGASSFLGMDTIGAGVVHSFLQVSASSSLEEWMSPEKGWHTASCSRFGT